MLRSLLLAVAFTAATASAQLTYSVTPVGPGCGPQLDASFADVGSHKKLFLDLSAGYADGWAASIWGNTQMNFTFPNGCTLYNDFSWGTSSRLDALGNTSFARAWPSGLVGYFRIQYVTFIPNKAQLAEFQLSNGVLVEVN